MRDDEVRTEAESRLRSLPYSRCRDLRVRMRKGCIVIEGTVGSYYEKQVVQEALKGINGSPINNKLVVSDCHRSS